MVDWQAIKTEYITTNIGYRKLAQKHGVNYRTLADRGKAEKWVDERTQYRDKTQSEMLDAASEQAVDRATKILKVADKLLDKIEAVVDAVDALDMSPKSIRALTAAVKDLKEIQGVKSDLDKQEQEARIANLRKQAEKDGDTANELEVIFAAGPEEWNE